MKLKTLLKNIEEGKVEVMNDIRDEEIQTMEVRNTETGKRKYVIVEK